MRNRYLVVLEVPEHNRCWRPIVLGSYKTLARATRRAEQVLAKHPTEITRFGCRPLGFCASVLDVRTGKQMASMDAKDRLVPSVGELGYW